VIRGLLNRIGLPPGQVEDAIPGQCHRNGEAPAIGRITVLDAGLPASVRACKSTGGCGSSLIAVINASMQVTTGVHLQGREAFVAQLVRSLWTARERRSVNPGEVQLLDSEAR
jgi:acetyl-CoA C-acetyltransferase